MTDRKLKGIQKITVNAADETNVLDVEIKLAPDDFLEPQFVPNTIAALGVKQWEKFWVVTITHDSWSSVWDSYLNDDGEGAVIPSFSITFELADTGTEVWTAEASKSYIQNRGELKAELEQERNPGVVEVIVIGTFTITHP
jgi:hypothetical protein